MAHVAFMGLLSCVDEVVFLEMRQLSESFFTGLAFERSLTSVGTNMDFKVRELSESLFAYITFIMHFTVLLLEWEG